MGPVTAAVGTLPGCLATKPRVRGTFALGTQTVHAEPSDAGGTPQVEPEGWKPEGGAVSGAELSSEPRPPERAYLSAMLLDLSPMGRIRPPHTEPDSTWRTGQQVATLCGYANS